MNLLIAALKLRPRVYDGAQDRAESFVHVYDGVELEVELAEEVKEEVKEESKEELSDETKVGDFCWGTLKHVAMVDQY